MEDDELLGAQGERGVRAALVITEFDLENAGCKHLDDRTNLTAQQAVHGEIFEKSDDVEQLNVIHSLSLHLT